MNGTSLILPSFFASVFFHCIIVMNNGSLKKYAIYDVYNNAYTHGGRLNVNFDCYFVYDIEHKGGHLTASKLRQRSKYMNRSNTSDITLRAGLVVSYGRQSAANNEFEWFRIVSAIGSEGT